MSGQRLWAKRRMFAPDPTLLAYRIGRCRWPWALLGSVLTVVLLIAVTFAFIVTASFFHLRDFNFVLDPKQPLSILWFALLPLPWLATPVVLLSALHKVPFRLQWAPLGRLRLSDFGKVAIATICVFLLPQLITIALMPQHFEIRPLTSSYLIWFLPALMAILVQTVSEEVLFKAYLTRVWGAVMPFRWPLIVVMVALFAGLHLPNSEFQADFWYSLADFIGPELISWLMFLRTGSLSAPAGWHFANNTIAFLGVSATHHEMQRMALVVYADPWLASGQTNITNPSAMAGVVLTSAAFAMLLFWHRSPLCLRPATIGASDPEPAPDRSLLPGQGVAGPGQGLSESL